MRYLVFSVFLLLCICQLALAEASLPTATEYSGSQSCKQCHQQQFERWKGSHHDQSMQHATPETVLGNFDDQEFAYNGIKTRFYKKGADYWIKTDGSDGQLREFKVAFTFGVTPLQQYLLETDKGRYQAFTIAWDTRDKSAGGQRWFHLYHDDKVTHEDVLHWTRSSYNWNSGCAHCHSTSLRKNYDVTSNRYDTRWADINVGCEACHGPGKAHVDHRKANKTDHYALTSQPGYSEIEHCGLCHSRRALLNEELNEELSKEVHAVRAMDTYEYRLLDESLYHVDGQIKDEVFDLGSFLQSKMHSQGVVCSQCHDVHSLSLKMEGNALCAQCHVADRYNTPQHHHHPTESAGAHCVNCHMPETTYMVVDPRRDHSIRIPRPDLSQALSTPNACSQCHDRLEKVIPLEELTRRFIAWYPERAKISSPATLFKQAQENRLANPQDLIDIANNESVSTFIRASALEHLLAYPSQESLEEALRQLSNKEISIQLAALKVVGNIYPMLDADSKRVLNAKVWPMLDAKMRALRFEAVKILAGVRDSGDPVHLSYKMLKEATREYIEYLTDNADIPAEQLQLGLLYTKLNQPEKARAAYEQALIIEPDFIPALLNMADFYRAKGEDTKVETFLIRALKINPDHAESNYSMGLFQVRAKNLKKAKEYLAVAAKAAPTEPQYTFVYAVSLFESGMKQEAVEVLKVAAQRFPDHQEIQNALSSYIKLSAN